MTTSATLTQAPVPPGSAVRRRPKRSLRSVGRSLTDRRTHLRLALLGVGAVIAFLLGYVGYVQYYDLREMAPQEPAANWTDCLYHSLMLFLPGTAPERPRLPVALDIARFLAPAVAGFAALGGLTLLFRDRIQQVRVAFMKKHVVVCGLGYVGSIFIEHLRDVEKAKRHRRQILRDLANGRWNWRRFKQAFTGVKVVVVEKDSTNPLIEMCRKQGVPVIIGDAQQERTLRAAGVQRALHLLAVCNEDAVNSQIIAEAQELATERHGELHCLARIGDPRLCSLLRWQQLNESEGDARSSLDFFNLDETGASRLLETFPPFDRETDRPHLLVSDLDGLGQCLIRQVASTWRGARSDNTRLWITVVDDDAVERVKDLKARDPKLFESVCEFICLTSRDCDLEQMEQVQKLREAPPVTRAYVTADRDEDALEAALALRQALNGIDRAIPLVVTMARDHGVARLISDPNAAEFVTDMNIKVFPMLEHVSRTEFVFGGSFESIAKAVHEHWRRMARELGHANPPAWAEVEEWSRQSSRAQARHIKVKVRTIGCEVTPLTDWNATPFEFKKSDDPHKDEVERLAHQEHQRWNDERFADGWKYCKPPSTKEKQRQKLSPYLVDFERLPPDIANYDREFVRAIPDILVSAGFQIVRRTMPDDGKALADN